MRLRHRLGIPHAVSLFGEVYRVRWGSTDPKHRTWQRHKHELDGLIDTNPDKRLIILNPEARRDPDRAWQAFVHEVLHVAEERLPKGSYFPHSVLERIARPLGIILRDAVTWECVCKPCKKKSTVVAKPTE